jgi:hypothetical protein
MNMNKNKKKKSSLPQTVVRVGRKNRRVSRRNPISGSENLYLLSLQDPQRYPGAKIPDLVSIPSSTFQTENYGIITSNAAGDQSMVFIPRLTAQTNLQTSATTTWTWVVGGYANNPQLATAVNIFEGVRPVSMKLRLDFIGATATDQGSVAAVLQARPALGASNEPTDFPTSFADLLSSENSYVAAARNGIEIIWTPQDAADLIYCDPDASFPAGPASYNDKNGYAAYPYLQVGCTGVAASTPTFRYTITVNWEALASVSTLAFVHTEPSPVNLSHLQDAFNWASNNFGKMAKVASAAAPYLQTAYNGLMASRANGAGSAALRLALGAAPLLLAG